MAEITTISFNFKEVIEALIKKDDLNEGIWQLTFEFGLGAFGRGRFFHPS